MVAGLGFSRAEEKHKCKVRLHRQRALQRCLHAQMGRQGEATSHAREKKKMKIFCVVGFCIMEGAREALMEIWERNLA